jgi:hypothetical protein
MPSRRKVLGMVGAAGVAAVAGGSSAASAQAVSGWAAQTPTYSERRLTALPRHGGHGMSAWGGGGRHLTTPQTAYGIVTSLSPRSEGRQVGTRLYTGSWEYIANLPRPLVIIVGVSGWYTSSDGRLDLSGPHLSVWGHGAPRPGHFLRNTRPANYGDEVQWWGIRSYIGDDPATNGYNPNNRDGGMLDEVQNFVNIGCEYLWSVDELFDGYHAGDNVGFVYCVFAEPLHHSIHTKGAPGEAWPGFDANPPAEKVMHGFGPLMGGGGSRYQAKRLSFQRCFMAHLGGRPPLTNSNACGIANNLFYNLGRLPEPPATTGAGWRAEAMEWGTGDPELANGPGWRCNWVGNVLVKGPQGTTVMPRVRTSGNGVPAGTKLFLDRNAAWGWAPAAQRDFRFPSDWPAGIDSTALLADVWPAGWGSDLQGVTRFFGNPLTPQVDEMRAMVDLFATSVGAQPAYRQSGGAGRLPALLTQARNGIEGTGDRGTVVNSVQGRSTTWVGGNTNTGVNGCLPNAGGWFAVTPSVAVDPAGPNAPHWWAPLPTVEQGRDQIQTNYRLLNGLTVSGYTLGECWGLNQYLHTGGAM